MQANSICCCEFHACRTITLNCEPKLSFSSLTYAHQVISQQQWKKDEIQPASHIDNPRQYSNLQILSGNYIGKSLSYHQVKFTVPLFRA